jgi:hypothetical protein
MEAVCFESVERWTLSVGRWALGVEKEPRRSLTP